MKDHPEIQPNYKHHMDFYHPPLLPMPDVPIPNHYGAFLQKRKHSVHTGVDLYAPKGSNVYAIEDGEVVIIKMFTGEKVKTPWWNETWAVYVKGYTGTVCYGEVIPWKHLSEGMKVEKGTVIGNVTPVLKKDKGKAMSMLHFSLHRRSYDILSEDERDMPLDPTALLVQLKSKADILLLKKEIDGHKHNACSGKTHQYSHTERKVLPYNSGG